jgi:hypothetical protein
MTSVFMATTASDMRWDIRCGACALQCVPEDHFVTRMGVIWANYDMRWWTERREKPELWAGHEMSQHAGVPIICSYRWWVDQNSKKISNSFL